MIWWSQGGGSNMYWTGVTNKLSYDKFAPCVGANNSEYACGTAVGQSSYGEYGRWLNNLVDVVVQDLYNIQLMLLLKIQIDNLMTIFIKKNEEFIY